MAGQITSLRFQKANQDRVNVYLDGEYAFALPAIEAAKLRKGDFLSDDDIQRLRLVDLEAKGYDRAVRFLAVRPRSEWEVRQNLRRYRPRGSEGLDEVQIEQVMERLRGRGYVDDEAFARYWIDQRNRFKPMAPQALRYELRRKGVSNRIIDAVVEAETDPNTAALEVARRQAHRWLHLGEAEFQKKLAGLLQRRGFRWETIRETIQQVWQEQEIENNDEESFD
ncbi:MAG: RecX family transcriptional regulator [Caldilineaceae bacterium]|nr:RecX family transcriptional regulator [Caldilineaceae bacterium]